jgi:hypothetical protein
MSFKENNFNLSSSWKTNYKLMLPVIIAHEQQQAFYNPAILAETAYDNQQTT